MPDDKPDFNAVFIATAAIVAGPHGLTDKGTLDQGRFISTFEELLEYYKILYARHGQPND